MGARVKAAPGRPPSFSRDDIVDCALDLLTRGGVKALSLRGVARELGCVLGTINYYFDNLADLEDAVAARLLEQVPVLDRRRSQTLREQLVEMGLRLIKIHSTHPYLRHVAGPATLEIAARQLQQDWSTLQAMGLPETDAILCMEVVKSLAHSRGNEAHRLRHGGETARRMNEELMRKLGRMPAVTLTADSYTPENMELYHRVMFGSVIDTFLRDFEADGQATDRVKHRKRARSARAGSPEKTKDQR